MDKFTQDYFLNRYGRHFSLGDITPPKPRNAVVVQVPPHNGFGDEIDSRISGILVSENLRVQRFKGPKVGMREVDVRPFLHVIERRGGEVRVECRLDSCGSVRIDEIVKLLGLEAGDLAGAISREDIQWAG